LAFRPIGRHIAQLHHARLSGDTKHLHKDVAKGLQVQLANITDGAKIRPILAHNGQKRQVALARLGDLRRFPEKIFLC
jgi:hypothetical protein